MQQDNRAQIKRCIKAVMQKTGYVSLNHLKFDIPLEPQKFYEDVGLLQHDRTRIPVQKLAFYQNTFWKWMFKYKYRMAVKSQKVGLSTTTIMENLQQALIPPTNPVSTMGYETLIIGQTEKKAKDHLDTLYKIIRGSDKYRPYLIEKPRPYLKRTEISTTTQILLENPYDPIHPSKIVGLGSNPGSVWSWKKVKKIHMSDPAAITKVDDAELYDAAFSRLAITNGWFVIESPPRGQRGQLWEIYKNSKLASDLDRKNSENTYSQFKIIEIPYTHAIEAGVMDEEFFIGERARLGPRFGQYYECEFLNPSNTWYDDSLFSYDSTLQLGEG